jgi:acetolactate decarboxylase
MIKRLGVFGLVLTSALAIQAFSASTSSAGPKDVNWGYHNYSDQITQIAPLEHLAQGGFDGLVTVSYAKQVANFGIGTFTGLDGEMIMLDGVVYQAPSNGVLRVATHREMIPFATLTQFRTERSFVKYESLATYADLQSFLSSSMPDLNQVLAIKITGSFKSLTIRSPQKQSQPYPTLTEALKTQAIFNLTNVRGTFVGFRHPAYFGTVNAAGYHFHFISDDRKIGGHVLEVATNFVKADVETVEQYNVTMGEAD